MLSKDESADDWREVTDKEKTALEESDAKWVRPPQILIDEWNEACVVKGALQEKRFGKYNEDTGFFELNGLKDIGTIEALAIRRYSQFLVPKESPTSNLPSPMPMGFPSGGSNFGHHIFQRTYFPIPFPSYGSSNCERLFQTNNKLEVVSAYSGYAFSFGTRGMKMIFYQCTALKEIIGEFQPTNVDSAFYNCKALETMKMKLMGLAANTVVDLHWSSKLSYESLKYSVDQGADGKTITITVHADVYAALQGQATYPFNGGALKEWEQLLVDAAGKNLTFATA